MTIQLNGQEFTTKEETYAYLIKQLDLPEYTGHNLDALWDILYDFNTTEIIIYNARSIIENLQEYGIEILNLFGDIHNETSNNISIYW